MQVYWNQLNLLKIIEMLLKFHFEEQKSQSRWNALCYDLQEKKNQHLILKQVLMIF